MLFGAPLQVVRGQVTGLPIPMASELAIESLIVPPEVDSRAEGLFGPATTLRRIKGVRYTYSGRPDWLDIAEVAKLIKEAKAKKLGV